MYLNGALVLSDPGRQQPDPFAVFKVPVPLQQGLNSLRVVVGNTPNYNWHWNGFSLVVESNLREEELLYLS